MNEREQAAVMVTAEKVEEETVQGIAKLIAEMGARPGVSLVLSGLLKMLSAQIVEKYPRAFRGMSVIAGTSAGATH